MNAIIYARVSTDEQAEKGYSQESQIETCRNYALDNGMNIVAEIRDDFTGSTLDRPGFTEVESLLARKEAQAIVITEADRLSRNAVNTLAIYEEWADAGIELHFCNSGQVNFGEESILVNGMPVLVAQYERMQFRKRTMNGRYNKAKSGKPVMAGPTPYGYRKKGKFGDAKLVKYEPELKVVRDIFEWYINGNGNGKPMSQRQIAFRLNDLNVPCSASKGWTVTRIHRMLKEEIYAGVTYYGRTRTRMKGGRKRILTKLPKEEWIKIPVPHLAVIDQATFAAAEARKERNKKLSLRHTKRRYLMAGHFRCDCGKAMSGFKTSDGFPSYQCSSSWKRPGLSSCPKAGHSIIVNKIEDLVWEWICNLLTDDQALEDGLNKIIEGNRDETGIKHKRLETLKKLIVKRENSIKRLVTELSEGEYSDEFTRNIFKDKIEENTGVIKELQKEQEYLESELAQVELTEDIRQEIHAMAAQVRDNLSDATFDNKRAVMDRLDLKAVFRYEDGDRWLDLICNLSPEGLSYVLDKVSKLGGRGN